MAINLKAKESMIQIGKYAGTYRYVLSPVIYNKLSEMKVIQEASIRSGINRSTLNSAWEAIGSVIQAWATEGHSVAIPGLGTMRFGVKATSASNVEKVSSDLITARKVIFTPSVAIKNELKQTSVSIACYDREGKLVKTVNSKGDDQGDFEVELIASPEEGGTLQGNGYYNDGDAAAIKAIPAEGYQFVKWDDDVTDAERTIQVTEDVTFVATFRKVSGSGAPTPSKFTLTVVSNDESMGTVEGSGEYDNGETVNLLAEPKSGYKFVSWQDGNTSASRFVQVTESKTYTATFAEKQV